MASVLTGASLHYQKWSAGMPRRLHMTAAALTGAALLAAVPSLASSARQSPAQADSASRSAGTPAVPTGEKGVEFMRRAARALGLQLTEAQLRDAARQVLGDTSTAQRSSGRSTTLAAAAADPCGSGADVLARACRAIFEGAKKAGANLAACGKSLGLLVARRNVSSLAAAVTDCGGPKVVGAVLVEIGLTLTNLCKAIVPNPFGLGDFACDIFT
jgi:hypothetical protein